MQISELETKHVSLEASAGETAELMQQTMAELGAAIEATHGRLEQVHQELLKKMVGLSCLRCLVVLSATGMTQKYAHQSFKRVMFTATLSVITAFFLSPSISEKWTANPFACCSTAFPVLQHAFSKVLLQYQRA